MMNIYMYNYYVLTISMMNIMMDKHVRIRKVIRKVGYPHE